MHASRLFESALNGRHGGCAKGKTFQSMSGFGWEGTRRSFRSCTCYVVSPVVRIANDVAAGVATHGAYLWHLQAPLPSAVSTEEKSGSCLEAQLLGGLRFGISAPWPPHTSSGFGWSCKVGGAGSPLGGQSALEKICRNLCSGIHPWFHVQPLTKSCMCTWARIEHS